MRKAWRVVVSSVLSCALGVAFLVSAPTTASAESRYVDYYWFCQTYNRAPAGFITFYQGAENRGSYVLCKATIFSSRTLFTPYWNSWTWYGICRTLGYTSYYVRQPYGALTCYR